MKYLPYHHDRNVTLIGALARWLWHTAARFLVPRWRWAAAVAKDPWARAVAARVLLIVAFLVQCVLLLVLGYMLDLALSLMELWAELARKHLEITL